MVVKRNMKILGFLHIFICIAVCGANIQTYDVSRMFRRNSSCECGMKNEFVFRIIGGRAAEAHRYPWMALVLINHEPQCGGALINNRYVLTAGHCTIGFKVNSYSVVLGVHDVSAIKNKRKSIFRLVDLIHLHEDYASDHVHDTNDISLLRLKNVVEFTPYIQPICLPDGDTDYSEVTATILGWGREEENGESAKVLKIAHIKMLPEKECKKSKLVSVHLTNTMLCGYRQNIDACQGDSGGPLIYKSEKGYYEEIGVISWGVGCARSGMPGVYTKISAYLEWIALHTRDSVYCEKPTNN